MYPTNRVSVAVSKTATPNKGRVVADTKDFYVDEKKEGDVLTVHASDAAWMKRAGIAEEPLAVANPIPDQVGTNGQAFSYVIPANAFSGGLQNVLSATKGDNTALPGWMSFNPTTRTLSGTAATGTTAVKITATSKGGQVVSDTFNVTVS